MSDLENKANKGLERFQKDGGNLQNSMDRIHAALESKLEEEEEVPPSKVRRLNQWWPLAAAAAVALLVGFFLLNSAPNNEFLFAEHFEIAPAVFDTQVRGNGNDNDESLLSKGNVAYQKGNYKEALSFWNQHAAKHPNSDELNTFRGITALAVNDNEAIRYLQNIQDEDYKDMAQWYLALAYLKKENVEDAKKILHQISKTEKHYKQKLATELLANLN